MQAIFALVDCNAFYVSCERCFNAAIQSRPVIVLSNNDGCAVAVSSEVKALGIKRGTPVVNDIRSEQVLPSDRSTCPPM